MGITRPHRNNVAVVRKVGKGLTMQATTLANRHIKDPSIKRQFIHKVDNFSQQIVDAFERGEKTLDSALQELKKRPTV